MKNKKEILNQIKFCRELAERLEKDCKNNLETCTNDFYSVPNHTSMKQDSMRIRRELNKFNKMIVSYY